MAYFEGIHFTKRGPYHRQSISSNGHHTEIKKNIKREDQRPIIPFITYCSNMDYEYKGSISKFRALCTEHRKVLA